MNDIPPLLSLPPPPSPKSSSPLKCKATARDSFFLALFGIKSGFPMLIPVT